MNTLLRRLFAQPKRRRHELHFVVYTRSQCSCCRKALELLQTYQRKYRFRIETIDIDDDPALALKHGQSVPVVAIDGKVRFRGVINPVLLERLLNASKS